MIEITSKENFIFKLAIKLQKKKYRDELGLYLVEGTRAVQDILAFNPAMIKHLIVSENKRDFPSVTAVMPEKLFALISETECSQGVIAIVEKLVFCPKGGRTLFLDRIRDPGNLGTLIRTAAAAGFNDIHLLDSVDAYSGKVIRSTVSAMSKVNLIDADSSTLEKLKSDGYTLLCADFGGQDAYTYRTLSDKICLVVGNESDGVSENIRDLCDVVLTLPMDNNVESLNAAVCGSILMYNLKYLL